MAYYLIDVDGEPAGAHFDSSPTDEDIERMRSVLRTLRGNPCPSTREPARLAS